MERVFRIADFVHAPRGRYYVGATYLVWCASDSLMGTVCWGTSSDADATELAELWDCDRAIGTPFDAVTDLLAADTIDQLTFGRVLRYVETRLPEYNARVRRHALVHSRGVSGAAIAGFNLLLATSFEWRAFDDRAAAFAWLGADERMSNAITSLVDTIRGQPRITGAVAALLAQDPNLDINAAAQKLTRSSRTLQRELQEDGTSFREQVALARLARARALLETTDQKLGAIALAVGLATSSQLVRLFNQQLGESPGAYRERTRRATK